MKMRTPILEGVYGFLLERNIKENDFVTENDLMGELLEKISTLFKEEERKQGEVMVSDYGYCQFCCGYISGFRTAMNIMQELESYKEDDFLIGILPSEKIQYHERQADNTVALEQDDKIEKLKAFQEKTEETLKQRDEIYKEIDKAVTEGNYEMVQKLLNLL